MMEWIQQHEAVAWWVAAASVVMFIGTLLVAPPLLARLPEDYFVRRERRWPTRHPLVHLTLVVLKNVLGWVLVMAGIAMLMLPGQGLITMLVGLVLVDFPGKRRLERWLISRRPIHRATTWLRARHGKPPLRVPECPNDGAARDSSSDDVNAAGRSRS